MSDNIIISVIEGRTLVFQAAEKFKAPQPTPVIPESKAASMDQEEESEEEEVKEN